MSLVAAAASASSSGAMLQAHPAHNEGRIPRKSMVDAQTHSGALCIATVQTQGEPCAGPPVKRSRCARSAPVPHIRPLRSAVVSAV